MIEHGVSHQITGPEAAPCRPGANDSATFLSEEKKELAYAPNAPVLVQGQFFPEGASLTHAYNHAAKI